MSILTSDGLSLRVGDGAVSEVFSVLRGATITQLTLSQRLVDRNAVTDGVWAAGVGTTGRRAVIDCDALATNETAAIRVRTLALTGAAGNFRLDADPAETVAFQAYVTQYKEITQAGLVKRFTCRLESTGVVTVD